MEAERNRRKQLLDTEASVIVAEGEKKRTILESEVSSILAKLFSLVDQVPASPGRASV